MQFIRLLAPVDVIETVGAQKVRHHAAYRLQISYDCDASCHIVRNIFVQNVLGNRTRISERLLYKRQVWLRNLLVSLTRCQDHCQHQNRYEKPPPHFSSLWANGSAATFKTM